MTCPHCSATTVTGALKCDHCGQPLDGHGETAVGDPIVPPIDALADGSRVALEADDGLRQQFAQALAAATPSVFVTPTLMAMNVMVFLAMVAGGASWLNPTSETLIRWGADYAPLTTHGQWWRLFTAMFVHIGAVHLVMNMSVLWIIGRLTERLFGNIGFIVLYLGAGIAGSLTSLVWHPLAAAAGASGAIFGLYGGLFGFLLIRRAAIPTDTIVTLSKSGLLFVMANLVYGVAAKGVDVTAHLGGFVIGMPLGCALAVPLAADLAARIQRSLLVAVASAALAYLVAVRVPIIDDWTAEMKRLGTLEQESAAVYDGALGKVRSDAMTREDFARVVNGKLLPAWEAQRAAITSMRIPEPQRTTARRIGEYMSLKAEAWHLAAEGIRTNDGATMQRGTMKLEAALVALQAVMPDAAAMNRLVQLRAARATAEAFAGEMERVTVTEKNAIKIFNDSLARLNAGRISRGQFADTIETQVLKPWNAERETLSGLKAPEGQEAVAKKIVEYMSLRSEGWLLASQAIRSNDSGLLQKAESKQAEASAVAKSIRGPKEPNQAPANP